MIPEEIKDCRDYIRLKFPGFFTDSWLTKEERIAKKREVRDAMVAVGYEPKLVQIAMRDPHYFYIEKEHVYPPGTSMSNPNHGWKTYTVVEKYRDQYGWWRRSVVWGEDTEAEAYKLRCEGHFVGTEAEVFAILGPVKGESPCGHLKGACACEDGLIVNKMYEISRKKKPPLQAQYIRWNNQVYGNHKHEFRTLDGTEWVSVKSEDVKTRVKPVDGSLDEEIARRKQKAAAIIAKESALEPFIHFSNGGFHLCSTYKTQHGKRVTNDRDAVTCEQCKALLSPIVVQQAPLSQMTKLAQAARIDALNTPCGDPDCLAERVHATGGVKPVYYTCSACGGEFEVVASKVQPHYDNRPDVHGTWHPPVFRPAIAGWYKMNAGEKLFAARAAGCAYCLKYDSSRSCPAHGWKEKGNAHLGEMKREMQRGVTK
jgi:hypothetical protein